jgi:bisanhydrobacterioruberin hydratase
MKKILAYRLQFSITVLWLFHVSALVGVILGYYQWFVAKTPLNLMLCAAAVVLCIWEQKRLLRALLIPFVGGLLIEWVGVHTGYPFGAYTYGENLGLKINGVPLLIGVNWAMLTFATAGLASEWATSRIGKAALAATLMTVLDIWMEPVAPIFDFWTFEGGQAPLLNYAGWWVVSLVIQWFYLPFEVRCARSLRWHLFALFLLFFAGSTWVMR